MTNEEMHALVARARKVQRIAGSHQLIGALADAVVALMKERDAWSRAALCIAEELREEMAQRDGR